MIPAEYAWLFTEPAPRILLEARKLFGIHEAAGSVDNPVILSWAKEIGVDWYNHDSIPWCGLMVAVSAHRAEYSLPAEPLRALSWATWGHEAGVPMLGDVLTFKREGGGHVGLYVGEDAMCFHVLGGNQSDQVEISRILRSRLHIARRSPWKLAQPTNVRRVFVGNNGPVSSNEQ